MLPEVDRKAILSSISVGEVFVRSYRESLKHSVDGCLDDDLTFIQPWRFELSRIKVSVVLYQGDADIILPFAHGKWLVGHLRQDCVRSHLLPDEGYISIAHSYLGQMLDKVLAASMYWPPLPSA